MKTHHHRRYRLTPEDYEALHTRLIGHGPAAPRSVSTLYLRSYLDRMPAYAEDAAAVPAEKYSLTYYDNDPSFIFLERRRDELRTSAMVTEAECRALLAGETDWLLNRQDPLFWDFHEGLHKRMLLPEMQAVYRRETYAAEDIGVWAALDTDIRFSMDYMNFLDPQRVEQGTVRQTGRYLLEVGYTDRIPDHILCLLEEAAPKRKLLPA